MTFVWGVETMFDSTLAFNRYRLEVVKSWPDGEVGELKDKLLAAIESSLRRAGQPQNVDSGNERPPGGQDSPVGVASRFPN